MNPIYLVLRIIRHFIPESLARYLLKRRLVIQPGLETNNPGQAAYRYIDAIAYHGASIVGKSVLVFGYGGRFAIGIHLLEHGAKHIILCDHFVSLDNRRNGRLLPEYSKYLVQEKNGEITPRHEFMTIVHGDINKPVTRKLIGQVDCVLSNSVYEHLSDVDGITTSLASITSEDGFHIHFVDLRDHYFKFPFQMLTYSERVWKSMLNPSSNLNRLRLKDYERIFHQNFENSSFVVLERLEKEFQAVQSKIRPQFLTGDVNLDSVSLIQIFAKKPRNIAPK